MGLQYTEATLKKKSVAELKELASDLFDEDELDEITTKQPLIDKLLDNDDDSGTEEEEPDEVEEEVEEEEDDVELPEEDEVDEAPPAPAKKAAAKKQTKYTEGGKAENGEKLLGAKEVATSLGTDAKSLRQFFRSGKSTFEPVGAGGRYEFKESDVEKIAKEFNDWKAGKPGRGRGTGEGGASKPRSSRRGRPAPDAADTLDEVEEIEELEPEDLEELDEDELELEEED